MDSTSPPTTSSEQRQLPRIPCQIQVSHAARSATLGEVVDISLDGVFVCTRKPLPKGSVIPLAFELEGQKGTLIAQSEVMRVGSEGMGLRFVHVSDADKRRLRRYVTHSTDVLGHRNTAIRLMQSSEEAVKPISNPQAIAQRLAQAVDSQVLMTIIPTQRTLREKMTATSCRDGELGLSGPGTAQFQQNEEVYVLGTLDFVSYSFASEVKQIDGPGGRLTLKVPELLFYSERRSSQRKVPVRPTHMVIRAPWRHDDEISWPVVDQSEQGLSFRVDAGQAHFFPGTPLPGAQIQVDEERLPLENAVVRQLITVDDPSGRWIKVGVEFGFSRQDTARDSEELENNQPQGAGKRFFGKLRQAGQALQYLYYRKLKRQTNQGEQAFKVVRFLNSQGKQLVGLLNTSFNQKNKTSCPLVILVPGFGGRKETFSALAMTMIDNFKRKYKDLAVLRIDGTNNLGESEKDPGCEDEGKHNINFTMSGTIADVLGCLSWADNNRFVKPTQIIFVSASFGTISVRHVLTRPEADMVSHWFVLMGASDAQSIMLHGSGNLDIYGNYLRGIKMGIINLVGCLFDADNGCRDLERHGLATLEDARRDMAKIKADVTWIIGREDALADPRRVADIMNVKAPGRREIIEVNAGHLPRSGEEALAEFLLLTCKLWRGLYGSELEAQTPSRGWLAACSKAEWDRVYKSNAVNSVNYWRNYLVGNGDLGFDILTYSSKYRDFVDLQVDLLKPQGKSVLDVGAGTGNVTQALAKAGARKICAIDLVSDALEKVTSKVPPSTDYAIAAGNVDGTSTTLLRRWLAGDLKGIGDLVGRVKGLTAASAEAISQEYDDSLHAILRGHPLLLETCSSFLRLASAQRHIVRDINRLCLALRQGEDLTTVELTTIRRDDFEVRGGLPYPDSSFDAVVSSLVVSYLHHPEDTLFEIGRVLRPKGRLVLSSMKPDADTSKTYRELLEWVSQAGENDLPPGQTRDGMLETARNFANAAADLMRIEEEGTFTFYSCQDLVDLVLKAGFVNPSTSLSFGDPGQASIVCCEKL